jgi:pyruvate dehydrogenase E1 component beta subunit
MERDPRVFVIGEDVRQGIRGITRGLFADFGPERVIDTPISEAGFTGFATGAALAGMRPVVEFQVPSLMFLAFEQIVNQAQKFSLMTGGQARVPVTYILAGSGARRGLAGQHSDHPYSLLIHAGVKTVIPATAEDAYGLLLSAIRDDDPVALFSPAAVQSSRGELSDDRPVVPLGTARVHRRGEDVTVVAVGHLVPVVLRSAEKLEKEDISVEVFDPRSLLPFDHAALVRSVAHTGRVLVCDDSYRTAGFGAEVAAFVAEECFESLRAPVRRVTRADVPVPFSVLLEDQVVPTQEVVVTAIRDLVRTDKLQS